MGISVSTCNGDCVACNDGIGVGNFEGFTVRGLVVESTVSDRVGSRVGLDEGFIVGLNEGDCDGVPDGSSVGVSVSMWDGDCVGFPDGGFDGSGVIGDLVGFSVGSG